VQHQTGRLLQLQRRVESSIEAGKTLGGLEIRRQPYLGRGSSCKCSLTKGTSASEKPHGGVIRAVSAPTRATPKACGSSRMKLRNNFPSVKGGGGAATAVAQMPGGCLANQGKPHIRTSYPSSFLGLLASRDNPRALGATPWSCERIAIQPVG
jgi:hypothetical protein